MEICYEKVFKGQFQEVFPPDFQQVFSVIR